MQSNGYSRSLDDPAVSVRNAPLGTGTIHSHANDCAPTRTAGESGGDHAMLLEKWDDWVLVERDGQVFLESW
jgi:hypothetical protein